MTARLEESFDNIATLIGEEDATEFAISVMCESNLPTVFGFVTITASTSSLCSATTTVAPASATAVASVSLCLNR